MPGARLLGRLLWVSGADQAPSCHLLVEYWTKLSQRPNFTSSSLWWTYFTGFVR